MNINDRIETLVRSSTGITEDDIREILIIEGYSNLSPKGWILV